MPGELAETGSKSTPLQAVLAALLLALGAMLVLSAVFMAMTFAVFAGYGVFAAAVRDHVLRRPRVLDATRKVFAATFALLAGRLALESR